MQSSATEPALCTAIHYFWLHLFGKPLSGLCNSARQCHALPPRNRPVEALLVPAPQDRVHKEIPTEAAAEWFLHLLDNAAVCVLSLGESGASTQLRGFFVTFFSSRMQTPAHLPTSCHGVSLRPHRKALLLYISCYCYWPGKITFFFKPISFFCLHQMPFAKWSHNR